MGCVWAVKEVIMYYVLRASAIYACFLDCSKAFDTVNHDVMFQKLVDCGLPCGYLRLLHHCYANQRGYVRWGNADSGKFPIRNGVRQGGILSPIFFNIYTKNLFKTLSAANLGCYLAGIFMGAFAYADDIVLIAPSLSALRKMLVLCEQYADVHHLSFNAAKTVCMYFPAGRRGCPVPHFSVMLDGQRIGFVDRFLYLGVWLNPVLDDNVHFSCLVSDFYRKFNACLVKFSFCDRAVFSHLIMTYCTSFYGSVCCVYDCVQLHCLCVAWNKCMRRAFRLPYRTHVSLLPVISGANLASVQIRARMLGFAHQCITSPNPAIKCLSLYCMRSNVHILGSNVCLILRDFDESVHDVIRTPSLFNNLKTKLYHQQFPDPLLRTGAFIHDILDCADGCILSDAERSDILFYMCCE